MYVSYGEVSDVVRIWGFSAVGALVERVFDCGCVVGGCLIVHLFVCVSVMGVVSALGVMSVMGVYPSLISGHMVRFGHSPVWPCEPF